jgi:hypothetical protein
MAHVKANTTALAAYQEKLISNSTDGRNLLRPDGVTLLAIEEGQFINVTPIFSILDDAPINFRLQIAVTNEFANQVIDNSSDIATLQTQIAEIPSPFWVAGKLSANGDVLSSRGRYGFSCARNNAGHYTITTTTNDFSDTNYIISIACQVDGGSAYARLNINAMTTSSFTILTYVKGNTADVMFPFTATN